MNTAQFNVSMYISEFIHITQALIWILNGFLGSCV